MRALAILLGVGVLPTGTIVAVTATQDVAQGDSVTIQWLQDVFQEAYVDVEIDADGDLLVRERAGLRLWVQLDTQRRLLNFFTVGPFRSDASTAEKLTFVNQLNSSIIGATFYMVSDNLMVADSYLLYGAQVSDERVMASYRWFRDAVIAAIRRDDQGILGDRAQSQPATPCDAAQPRCVRTKT